MMRTMYKKSHWQLRGLERVVSEAERAEATLFNKVEIQIEFKSW